MSHQTKICARFSRFFPVQLTTNDNRSNDETGGHFYGREDLLCEYTLRQEKREFAEGAWRAVMQFLYGNGFVLSKNGKEYDLGTSSGYDVESAG